MFVGVAYEVIPPTTGVYELIVLPTGHYYLLTAQPHTDLTSMPGQRLSQANPPPDPSHLPDSILDNRVQLGTLSVSDAELAAVEKFRCAANYIAAGES